jgi:hypothetical protein
MNERHFGLFCLRRRSGLATIGLFCVMSGPVLGQEGGGPASPAVVSAATISGSVICADTNGPARLAMVILRSTTASAGGKMMADSGHSVPVGLDGSYRFTNVRPGTYQIGATLAGYIDPLGEFSPEDFASQDPEMQKRIRAAAQVVVTITGNESAHIDLRLERGASISGRVLFEDGSPAIGWQVQSAAAPAKGAENPFVPGGLKNLPHLPVTTDDTGHFRLSGLPSGEYVLQARVNVEGMDRGGFAPTSSGAGMEGNFVWLMGIQLTAYSGSAMHVADAKAVSVSAGDEWTGVEIVVPLYQMHAVSGHVLAKTDAHAVNFGTVELADKKDSSVTFTATLHEDGSFRFEYVPGNSEYTLTTDNVQDAVTTGTTTMFGQAIAAKKTVRKYGQVSQEVVVMDSDVDGVNVLVAGLP